MRTNVGAPSLLPALLLLLTLLSLVRMLAKVGMWESRAAVQGQTIFQEEAIVTSKIKVEEALYPREVSANPTFSPQTTSTTPMATFITTYWCLSYTTLTTMDPAPPYGIMTTGTTTWVEVEFTQNYLQPTMPPSPVSGSIGLGSLTGTVGFIRETGIDGIKKPGVLEGGAGRLYGLGVGKLFMMVMGVMVVVGMW